MEPGPGTLITKELRLVEPLAEGAMGKIWRAEHLRLGHEVAVKLIQAELAREAPQMIERFAREAKAVAQIDSRHVVKIVDFGLADDGMPYMAMELLEGSTLTSLLDRVQQMSLYDTARLVVQVARVLDAAHRVGIVHRDIKPDNLFIIDDGSGGMFVKVLDFGVAKHTQTNRKLTMRGAMVGTPHYMSPEQIKSAADIDARADLWGLAVLAYEALSGVLPFDGPTLPAVFGAVMGAKFKPISEVVAQLPAGIDAWFARSLALNVEQRYQTAREMAEALRALVDAGGIDRDLDIDAPAPEAESDDEISSRNTFPELHGGTPGMDSGVVPKTNDFGDDDDDDDQDTGSRGAPQSAVVGPDADAEEKKNSPTLRPGRRPGNAG
jgi:eukaryotic-like serine/threonine-protein kinase